MYKFLFLFLLAPSVFAAVAPPRVCTSSCEVKLADYESTHTPCQYTLANTFISGSSTSVTVTCNIQKVPESCGGGSSSVDLTYTCTGACPSGTEFNSDSGKCELPPCSPSSPDFIGYYGTTPKCSREDLPDNCGVLNGDIVCWDPVTDTPPEEDPNIDPDNPPAPDPAENPDDGDPSTDDLEVDEESPLYEEPPAETDPRLATGGGDCSHAPRCSGDQIDCDARYQLWKIRCANEKLNDLFTDYEFDDPNADLGTDTVVTQDLTGLSDSFTQSFEGIGADIPTATGWSDLSANLAPDLETYSGNVITAFPEPDTCTDMVINFPHSISITVDCDHLAWVKETLHWLLYFYMIYTFFLVITDPRNAGQI